MPFSVCTIERVKSGFPPAFHVTTGRIGDLYRWGYLWSGNEKRKGGEVEFARLDYSGMISWYARSTSIPCLFRYALAMKNTRKPETKMPAIMYNE